MKVWNFKIKSNPKEISKKLESTLGSINGFVFNIDSDKNNSVTFKVRKRILYGWYMLFHNYIIVKGKLLKTNSKNETIVEIHFIQHFLMKLIIFTNLFLGLSLLILILSGISSSPSIYITGGILVTAGVVSWINLQKVFDSKIQTYKTLISEILEF